MDSAMIQPAKVSMSARLIAFMAYIFPALGGAMSSFYLIGTLQALKQNESAGLGAVTGALAESTYPVLISLYLAAFLGIGVIVMLIARMMMQTQKTSPSAWFFLVSGTLCLVPAVLFLEAESSIIEVLLNPRTPMGIAAVASNINLLSISSIASALIVFVLLFIIAVVPFSSRSRPKWSPLFFAIAIELLIFAFCIAFQLRLLWLINQYKNYG